MPAGPEKALLVAFVATSLLFAGRKYTQAIKDDIGDKSVFMCVPAIYRVKCCVATSAQDAQLRKRACNIIPCHTANADHGIQHIPYVCI